MIIKYMLKSGALKNGVVDNISQSAVLYPSVVRLQFVLIDFAVFSIQVMWIEYGQIVAII